MTSPYDYIYLSPHYDDISLSCGGVIHQQIAAGQSVLVITICAAPPAKDAPLSAFAQKLHATWGHTEDMVAIRQAEDQAAMKVLGVDYHRLNFTDCIYRGDPHQEAWYYPSIQAIFGDIHPADLPLAAKMAAAIAGLIVNSSEAIICAPLTVGHHVDHQLTYAAALHLQQRGWPVIFYEDYPYSDPDYPFTRPDLAREKRHSLAATLEYHQQTTKLLPELHFLSETDLQVKVDSVKAYVSQLAMLFGDEAAMAKYIRHYALNVGQGKPAERTWRPE